MSPAGAQTIVKTICPLCGVGCGVEALVRDGALLGVRGDTDHPVNQGRLCTKGALLHRTVHTRDRLQHPMIRPDRNVPFEQAGMEKAIAWAAGRIQEIRRLHGPDSVAFYVSGQLMVEDYYVANKLVKGFLGTNNIDTNSRLCMASAVAGYKLTLGSDAPPGCYADLDEAEVVLIVGSNMAECHPVLFRRLDDAKRLRPDLFVVVIDPRRTPTVSLADIHLRVRPGTDVILLQAMLRVIFEEGLADETFIETRTAGVEDVRAAAASLSPADAAERCGVPEHDLREVARRFARARGAVSLWAMGLNQATDGVARNVALINLHLSTGQIGRPGSGPFSLTGQANAMGGRQVGGMSTQLAAHRDLANPTHRAEVAAFWGVPGIRSEPGLRAVELFEALESGRVKAIWIACTNPMVSLPDAVAAENALRKAKLVVVQDLYHPTDTTRFAHLVLPAAGWGEKEGVMINSERGLAYCGKAVDPPGEAEPDWKMFARLGRALGHGPAFAWKSAAEVFAEHAALTRGTDTDVSGLDYAMLQQGPVQWPFLEGAGTVRRYTDLWFAHPDGRARFVVPQKVAGPPSESCQETLPLRLLTGRLRDQWHTRTKTGRVAELSRHEPEPRLSIAPEDAAPRGIRNGDLVEVRSRRGVLHVGAKVTDEVPTGAVFLPFHWGALEAPHARANDLTQRLVDPISGQPALKSAAVEILRCVPRAPSKTLLLGAGEAAAALGRALRRLDGTARIETIADGVVRVDPDTRRVSLASGETIAYERIVLVPRSLVRGKAGLDSRSGRVICLAPDADVPSHLEGLLAGSPIGVVGEGMAALQAALAIASARFRVLWLVGGERPLATVLDAVAWSMIDLVLQATGVQVVKHAAIEDLIEGEADQRDTVRIVLERGEVHEVARVLYVLGREPDLELAVRAGVAVNRGILVDERLSTTRDGISAMGPAVEVDGWMLEAETDAHPTVEAQADVLARRLCGDPTAVFRPPAARGAFRVGEIEGAWLGSPIERDERDQPLRYLDRRRRVYRKAILRDGRLVGALLVGDRRGEEGLRRMIEEGVDAEPLRRRLLDPDGDPLPDPRGAHVVCACLSITDEAIHAVAANGAKTLEEISRATGIGSMCGTCLPEARLLLSSR